MYWDMIHKILIYVQHTIYLVGVLIILTGIIIAVVQYLFFMFKGELIQGEKINVIRLSLSRVLILGLEFIVAADLISTTTTPDYYSIGLVAIVVAIRTVLSFSINREIMTLSKPGKIAKSG
jgi:uncharacterized membrane protein